MAQTETHTPVRLVVCVDGTWLGPDGIDPTFKGNISTIFRIWCCIKEGEVTDKTGKLWRQERVYFKGLNDLESWYGKLLAGAFGKGAEQQIQDVYRVCCERASHPEDEIFFFGFSRGAFVVRAVANLLTYMKIPGRVRSSHSFSQAYKHLLSIYKEVRLDGERRQGSIYEYMSACQIPAKIQYIGVVDTVKAFDDDGLYEIGIHSSHHHCRQALSMNETRVEFLPELWAVAENTAQFELRKRSRLHSVLEGWFLGTHGDLGGGNQQDGAALYPAQWLLSEAQQFDLVLEFCPVTYTSALSQNSTAIENPLELMFPSSETPESENPFSEVTLSNGIVVPMWEMNDVHCQKKFGFSIQHGGNRWLLSSAPRNIFYQDLLIGYHDKGVFIHPSAYKISDQNPQTANAKAWPFLEQFNNFRQQALQGKSWAAGLAIGEHIDAKFRVLVCGNAGIGKSTLINLLFGIPETTPISEFEHGIHDINEGFSPNGAKHIVHDSCGFQTGQNDEIDKVKEFLKTRSSSSQFAERLHTILYCISSTRLRVTDSADEEFFQALSKCDANIPVIVISTRIDEVEALCNDQAEKDVMLKHGKKFRRQLLPADWDEIEAGMKSAVDIKKQQLIDGLARLNYPFKGPLFTSKESQESISAVANEITKSLTDDTLRAIFVAAQMSSLQPKIEYAISNSIRLYGYALRTAVLPIAFSGLAATTTVTGLIVKDIMKVFQFNEFSGDIATRIISNLLISNYKSNGIYVAANVLSALSAGSLTTGVGAIAGVALGAGSYSLKLTAVPQFGRLLLMCTVDTILIMETVFWQCDTRTATPQDVQAACASYKSLIEQVHAEIESVLPVWAVWNAFQFEKISSELARVVDTYRFRRVESEVAT